MTQIIQGKSAIYTCMLIIMMVTIQDGVIILAFGFGARLKGEMVIQQEIILGLSMKALTTMRAIISKIIMAMAILRKCKRTSLTDIIIGLCRCKQTILLQTLIDL